MSIPERDLLLRILDAVRLPSPGVTKQEQDEIPALFHRGLIQWCDFGWSLTEAGQRAAAAP